MFRGARCLLRALGTARASRAGRSLIPGVLVERVFYYNSS